ncbi:MAG: hypothetical protein QG635_1125 [Bacteroidota bacterium]|nr:hypothetical protein [Bacteroidota bacterium]
MKKIILLTAMILSFLAASAKEFDLESYKTFLKQTENLSSSGLYGIYPPGLYKADVLLSNTPLYLDSVKIKMKLTDYELSMLQGRSFMASERLSYNTLNGALKDVWEKDLPCFISADIFLHAIHMSYDAILKDIEQNIIIGKLNTALQLYFNHFGALAQKYSSNKKMTESLADYDVYFTVALRLLNNSELQPNNSANAAEVNRIMNLIAAEQFTEYALFSTTLKKLDFSQFTPRGHYEKPEELRQYFKCMMWLGRTELYLLKPTGVEPPEQTEEDIQRQIIDAALISTSAAESGASVELTSIDDIIKAMVGESDNVIISNMLELLSETGITDPSELTDLSRLELVQNTLKTKPYAPQKILSQVLISNPFDTEQIVPASAFMLMGQRFIIDSYVFSNVVYDKIIFNKSKVLRMMPSSLDVLFSLGNNAASDLLEAELAKYPYSTNLAGLRYLIDSYDDSFWDNALYNNWLNMIRSLNPGDNDSRAHLPSFMQSAAWWQSRMNTQLASWAQLRHDNLLYAKQSYTGGTSCSFPYVYLDPVPDFYRSMRKYAQNANEKLTPLISSLPQDKQWIINEMVRYLDNVMQISDNLITISEKELNGEPLNKDENQYLSQFFSQLPNCGPTIPDGWFADLFYHEREQADKLDLVVADVHTQPTDEFGNMIGKVFHVGTGLFNLCAIIVNNQEGNPTVFLGPVMSYYEYMSLDFKRLTDTEWKDEFLNTGAFRPEFVDLYLADINGEPRYETGQPLMLPVEQTSVENDNLTKPDFNISAYPNPFSDRVQISFRIPYAIADARVSFSVYDISGNEVFSIPEETLLARNYMIPWNGTDNSGNRLNGGAYIYTITVNGESFSGKVVLAR